MNINISTSLNMRSLKEAVADQEQYEEKLNPVEEIEDSETDFQLAEYQPTGNGPMDRMNKDLDELDQVVFEHTKETDGVIDSARDGFDTIFTLAQSVPPEKSARLFEVAAQYLDIINKSSDSKVTAKHDRAKLNVAIAKAQIQAGLVDSAVEKGITAHRNDILKAIMGGNVEEAEFTDDSDKEEDK